MASPESRRVRAAFGRREDAPETSVEEGRRGWEEAVADANRALAATVTPVECDGVAGEWVSDGQPAGDGAVLYLHGGGFNAGSCRTHRALAYTVARATGVPVLTIDYRLAPEHPFPAGLDDATTAYEWLLGRGIPAERIAIGGDSAGGGLALSLLVNLRDRGGDLPAAAFLISPWVDLALTGESMRTHADLDPLTSYQGLWRATRLYLGDGDPTRPLASPLYADLDGLPPMLIQTGGHEVLIDDARRLAERLRAAGGVVTLEVWDEMWHVWHAWADEVPEARQATERIGAFVRKRITAQFGSAERLSIAARPVP